MKLNKALKQLDFPESYISITLGFLVVIVAGILAYNYFTRNKPGQILTTGNKTETMVEDNQPEITANLPTTYTVVANDNLWKIAEKFYKSGYNWVTIATANKLSNADNIEVGQKLNIPVAVVIKPEIDKISAATAQKDTSYVVVKGDNLWKIAVVQYTDGYAWSKIAKANNLVNPNLIHPGNILRLPR